MAQTTALVEALKNVLKVRGITYATLAKSLDLSEASVKRVFASRSFTLERLDRICDVLEIEITDLARMVLHEAPSPSQLTHEQEKELVSDPKLLLVAVHALNHWTFDQILETYALTKPECIRLLTRLDRLGVLNLLPNNRIRVRVSRTFAWLPDGPIQQFFRRQLQTDFFSARFDQPGEAMVFVSGMLSRSSNAVVQNRIRRMSAEFTELHNQDVDLPLAERFGTNLLIAVRPWVPELFLRLQRSRARR